jgi:hypothetical protein
MRHLLAGVSFRVQLYCQVVSKTHVFPPPSLLCAELRRPLQLRSEVLPQVLIRGAARHMLSKKQSVRATGSRRDVLPACLSTIVDKHALSKLCGSSDPQRPIGRLDRFGAVIWGYELTQSTTVALDPASHKAILQFEVAAIEAMSAVLVQDRRRAISQFARREQ